MADPRAIDHIGVVVRNLEASSRMYSELLGAEEVAREDLPEHGVSALALRYGHSLVELISPTSTGTGVARFLETRGEGLHHVAYRVENVRDELERLKGSGVRLVDETPRVGLGGRLVAFIHPAGACGVLTELVEPMAGGE